MRDRPTLFSGHEVGDVIRGATNGLRTEIENFDKNYIVNVGLHDLAEHLISKYTLDVPVLLDDQKQISDEREVMREINDYGQIRTVKMPSVTIAVPFTGDPDMFSVRPSTFYSSGWPAGEVVGNELRLTFVSPNNNPATILSYLNNSLQEIRQYLEWMANDVKKHNDNLRALVEECLRQKKEKSLSNMNMIATLNIPIRPKENGPRQTYRVPDIQRRIEVPKPKVTPTSYQPEPAISIQDYEDILRALEQMIIAMERSPETYQTMGEEDLRNLLLMQLNVTYQGRATGETFNRNGKTDILIREEGKNVFIAECKIWRGSGQFKEAIDQLLGYTCWRDTKTALLIFNRNKDHTAVLQQIETATPGHPCCKKIIGKNGSGHFRYLFHQPDDKNREIYLSVMAFHVPTQ